MVAVNYSSFFRSKSQVQGTIRTFTNTRDDTAAHKNHTHLDG